MKRGHNRGRIRLDLREHNPNMNKKTRRAYTIPHDIDTLILKLGIEDDQIQKIFKRHGPRR